MKNLSPRLTILKEFLQVVLGLLVFAYGVHLTMVANIGLQPWDCLGMGISMQTPLNYGLAMTSVSVIVLIIDICIREPIGYGIVLDALLTGNFAQFFNSHCILPQEYSVIPACGLILLGLCFMAFGMFIYMSAAQSCGPRDSLLVGLGKRFPKLSIGMVQNCILVTVLFIGWRLGGKVGVGTVLATFGNGIILNFVFKLMHFNSREVKHKTIAETNRILMKNRYEVMK